MLSHFRKTHLSENSETCPEDCSLQPLCGDGTCNGDETCETCPQDCGSCCGNGACEQVYGENCTTCSQDCGPCPNCTPHWFCKDGKTRAYISESCQVTYFPCGSGPWCCRNGACYKSTSPCPNYVSIETPALAQVQGPDLEGKLLFAFGMSTLVALVVYAFIRTETRI